MIDDPETPDGSGGDDGGADGRGGGAAPEPRANPFLLGHDEAEATLLAAFAAGRLPPALILGGPRGIGKATLAYRLARFLLARAEAGAGSGLFAAAPPPPPATLALPADHPAFRRVAAAGHADLFTLERGRDPRRKDRLRSEIVVEDTREVAAFLRLTSAEGGWRVVVVDAADELNRNAANALLKILEEPPARALLLLVCHNPGRLLPTIRSRCRKLTLKPLRPAVLASLLARYRPDIPDEEGRVLAGLAEGSIGRALDLAQAGGSDLYRALLKLLSGLPKLDAVALHGLADRLARADAEPAYRACSELLIQFLARMIAGSARGEAAAQDGEAGAEILVGEQRLMRRLAARRGLDQWVEVWEKVARLFAQADGLTLDRKQVVLGAFLALEAAAR